MGLYHWPLVLFDGRIDDRPEINRGLESHRSRPVQDTDEPDNETSTLAHFRSLSGTGWATSISEFAAARASRPSGSHRRLADLVYAEALIKSGHVAFTSGPNIPPRIGAWANRKSSPSGRTGCRALMTGSWSMVGHQALSRQS